MILSVIAAVSRNGIIGRDNALPWHLPEDLKRFKALTMGHHIIMGRRTYESLGRLLPGRTTVIVSRSPGYQVPGARVESSLRLAIAACEDDPEVFVIGGAALYREALPIAQRLYLTEIDGDFEGDVRFPDYDRAVWEEKERETHVSAQGLHFSFVRLEKRAPSPKSG
ncbi:MAG: dihydrofolate reductase [Methylophilaceae bacterium]|nr:dihydrofolate reductase [Methylophilaceae bacterium]